MVEKLEAGTGRCDITPAPGTPQGGWGAQTHERGDGADMPFYATALALRQGAETALIVELDAIGFDGPYTARLIAEIANRYADQALELAATAPPVAWRTRLARSSPSSSTTSPPCACTAATAPSRRTTFTVRRPRALASCTR